MNASKNSSTASVSGQHCIQFSRLIGIVTQTNVKDCIYYTTFLDRSIQENMLFVALESGTPAWTQGCLLQEVSGVPGETKYWRVPPSEWWRAQPTARHCWHLRKTSSRKEKCAEVRQHTQTRACYQTILAVLVRDRQCWHALMLLHTYRGSGIFEYYRSGSCLGIVRHLSGALMRQTPWKVRFTTNVWYKVTSKIQML